MPARAYTSPMRPWTSQTLYEARPWILISVGALLGIGATGWSLAVGYWTVWRGEDAIGSVDLSAVDFGHRRGEVGFLFRPDQWGFGFAREAMRRAKPGSGFNQSLRSAAVRRIFRPLAAVPLGGIACAR